MDSQCIVNVETGVCVDARRVECEQDVDVAIANACQNLAAWTKITAPTVMTFKHFVGDELRIVKQVMVKPVTQYQVIKLPKGEQP